MVADWDSIFIGRGVEGAVITAGGWGPLFGNEGSLQSLIREGLRAAAQHHDGRGPQTPLTKAFCSALNLQDFSDSAFAIYQHGISAEQLFPLACIMQQTAEAGDEVTLRLFEQSAYELVDGVRLLFPVSILKHPFCSHVRDPYFRPATY